MSNQGLPVTTGELSEDLVPNCHSMPWYTLCGRAPSSTVLTRSSLLDCIQNYSLGAGQEAASRTTSGHLLRMREVVRRR